jgi:hypothetical protein
MTGFPRVARSAVFLAALLHTLVGGWGPWLHGAPPSAGAAVHAGASQDGPQAEQHGKDCALCHSASLLKAAEPRPGVWPIAVPVGFDRFRANLPSAHLAPPVRSGDARAPPLPV